VNGSANAVDNLIVSQSDSYLCPTRLFDPIMGRFSSNSCSKLLTTDLQTYPEIRLEFPQTAILGNT
jgi:hypothetical protein